jgi:hypothetical protein
MGLWEGANPSHTTPNPNPNPKQPDTFPPSPILPLTKPHIILPVPYQWQNGYIIMKTKPWDLEKNSDTRKCKATAEHTHSLTLSSLCTRAMSQAVGLISKNVPGTYPTIPSFLWCFFLSVWFLRNSRKKKGKRGFWVPPLSFFV